MASEKKTYIPIYGTLASSAFATCFAEVRTSAAMASKTVTLNPDPQQLLSLNPKP